MHVLYNAKILILHGFLDTIASQEELSRFENEMNKANVDWQAHIFGNAMHAFATPEANDAKMGTLYNPIAAHRAWKEIQHFLFEIFA